MAIPAITEIDASKKVRQVLQNEDKRIDKNKADIVVLNSTSLGFGAWISKSNNTVYQAATDGCVSAFKGTAAGSVIGYTDGSDPPTTIRQSNHHASEVIGISFVAKKDDYWKVTGATTVFWIPLEKLTT